MSSPTEPEHGDRPLESFLSERDQRILEFERQWWRNTGAKEEAIRAEFSLSAARYYQLLNAVIDLPDAVRADPMLINRLQRASRPRRGLVPPTISGIERLTHGDLPLGPVRRTA
jgi:hypothetical protein